VEKNETKKEKEMSESEVFEKLRGVKP